jgi:uncharacterized protein YjbI with pentapeptide repeats
MANPEHVDILKQGVKVWDKWKQDRQVKLKPSESRPQLSSADFSGAILSGADLVGADLVGADLSRADLSGADFNRAALNRANLKNANLSLTRLVGADLSGAILSGADFTDAKLGYGSFGNNDLSQVKGLETVRHSAPSTIGIDTIYKSRGQIPEVFLRGCGVPESFIVQIPALVAAMQPIQFYSCFISYSSKDQDFAERLYADLQSKGVRCWFAPEDLKIGAEIRVGIDESIRVYDKLLLVLSETSVKSQWVQQEVETALAKEREQGRTVLFPIRLDDAVMEVNVGWPSYLRYTRNIGDFTRWKDHDAFEKSFARLLRDLKAEENKA